MRETNAIITIAFRDLTKLLRDKTRLVSSFVFPILFIGVLGAGFNASFGDGLGYSFITFVFTGILAQTLFQSTASGVISLVEDRENDFSKELFVAPVSRYSIITGKILGESLVSLIQAIGIVIFGVIIGVPLSLNIILIFIPVSLLVSMLGGAFGILVLSNMSSERKANQVFRFIMFPQFFLAGVFNPIDKLPTFLTIISRFSPMTYAVDLTRGAYTANIIDSKIPTMFSTSTNLIIITMFFFLFLIIGTFLFVKNERNR